MFGFNDEVLKGDPPYHNYKAKKKARPFKQKVTEWYRDYCQDHHWDRGVQLTEMLDKDGDSYVKPSLKLFAYNVYRNLRGWYPIYRTRMICQKIFRANHISDNELWDLQYPLAKYNLKYIKAFRESERNGYPSCFSEYNENEWKTKVEYDEKIADGSMIGGGEKAWEKVLDLIIMSLEFIVIDGNKKKETEWYLKYFGMCPYEENNECNRHTSYDYREIDAPKTIGSTHSSKMPDLDKVEWATKSTSWLNMELIFYAEDCVNYGLELFGKFFRSMWD